MKTIKEYKQDIELYKNMTNWNKERREEAIKLAEFFIKIRRDKNAK